MADVCANCGSKITLAGIFSAANQVLPAEEIAMVNFVHGADYQELCNSCGGSLRQEVYDRLNGEREKLKSDISARLSFFPILTVGVLPKGNEYLAMGLVTANVTVGTGIFNEFSQGFSDMFGAVNQNSGMALKVNKGEAAARSIIIQKALQIGGNCIIGADLDYGVTNNNAATINMQGTAVLIPDLSQILGRKSAEMANWISWAWGRSQKINRWMSGNILPDDQFVTE